MAFPLGLIALWSGLGALTLWAASKKPSAPMSPPLEYTPELPPVVRPPPPAAVTPAPTPAAPRPVTPAPAAPKPATPAPVPVTPRPAVTPPAPNLTPAGAMFDQLGQQMTLALKAMGYDSAGNLKPGIATAETVQAATALAALLDANGLTAEAASLRSYATKAANTLKVPPCPGVPVVLPAEVQTAVCRVMNLERDPKVIRDFTTALRGMPQSSDPQVVTLIKLLEATSATLEAQQSKADTEAKIAEVLAAKTPGVMPAPIPEDKHSPPRLSAELQALVDAAMKGLGVSAGVVKGPVTQDGLIAARQATDALVAAGYPELAAELRYYLMFAERMASGTTPTTAAKPAAPTTTVVTPPAPAAPKTHTVKAGDTGTSIAKTYTGDPNRWRELAKANPKTTSSARGPNVAKWGMVIYPNEVLTLPSGW